YSPEAVDLRPKRKNDHVQDRYSEPHLKSRLRHTNLLVIADRGFPYWPMIETIDIALVDDLPTVLQVLAAIRPNFVIGQVPRTRGRGKCLAKARPRSARVRSPTPSAPRSPARTSASRSRAIRSTRSRWLGRASG